MMSVGRAAQCVAAVHGDSRARDRPDLAPFAFRVVGEVLLTVAW